MVDILAVLSLVPSSSQLTLFSCPLLPMERQSSTVLMLCSASATRLPGLESQLCHWPTEAPTQQLWGSVSSSICEMRIAFVVVSWSYHRLSGKALRRVPGTEQALSKCWLLLSSSQAKLFSTLVILLRIASYYFWDIYGSSLDFCGHWQFVI